MSPMFWRLFSSYYSRTSIKRPPFKRPPSIKRPFFKVRNYFRVSKLQYSIPLLNGQPLLSGQFSKSRGWPLNRGPTVVGYKFWEIGNLLYAGLYQRNGILYKNNEKLLLILPALVPLGQDCFKQIPHPRA